MKACHSNREKSTSVEGDSKTEEHHAARNSSEHADEGREMLDDLKLAQQLQMQFDLEAKTEVDGAGSGSEGGGGGGGGGGGNFTGDEAYARQLQMQIDSEYVHSSRERRRRRESRTEVLLRTGAIEPSQLQYEQLLELDVLPTYLPTYLPTCCPDNG